MSQAGILAERRPSERDADAVGPLRNGFGGAPPWAVRQCYAARLMRIDDLLRVAARGV